MDIITDIFSIKNGNCSKNIFTIGDKDYFNGMFYVKKNSDKDIDYEYLGAKIADTILKYNMEDCFLDFPQEKLYLIISGIYLKLWTLNFKKNTMSLQKVFINMNKNFQEQFKKQQIIIDGIIKARTLSGTPANICTPYWMVQNIKNWLSNPVTIFEEKDIISHKMNMLMAVAQGSKQKPYVAKMQVGKKPKIALIGKGVTFDSGGISIKPSRNMHEMIADMSGAAAVIGAMTIFEHLNIPVMGLVGLVENMPSGNATKPGDIIETSKGTVQILNTDAEGRLVLGDLVNYASDVCKCDYIIDIATLTGAATYALGTPYTSMCTNSEVLNEINNTVSNITNEKAYRLPSGPEYDYLVKGTHADYQNIYNKPEAGVIAGAKFIEIFINKSNWLHLDIGATGINVNELSQSPFNGYGVRYLVSLVEHLHKKQ